jgi:hypothetical protein
MDMLIFEAWNFLPGDFPMGEPGNMAMGHGVTPQWNQGLLLGANQNLGV